MIVYKVNVTGVQSGKREWLGRSGKESFAQKLKKMQENRHDSCKTGHFSQKEKSRNYLQNFPVSIHFPMILTGLERGKQITPVSKTEFLGF